MTTAPRRSICDWFSAISASLARISKSRPARPMHADVRPNEPRASRLVREELLVVDPHVLGGALEPVALPLRALDHRVLVGAGRQGRRRHRLSARGSTRTTQMANARANRPSAGLRIRCQRIGAVFVGRRRPQRRRWRPSDSRGCSAEAWAAPAGRTSGRACSVSRRGLDRGGRQRHARGAGLKVGHVQFYRAFAAPRVAVDRVGQGQRLARCSVMNAARSALRQAIARNTRPPCFTCRLRCRSLSTWGPLTTSTSRGLEHRPRVAPGRTAPSLPRRRRPHRSALGKRQRRVEAQPRHQVVRLETQVGQPGDAGTEIRPAGRGRATGRRPGGGRRNGRADRRSLPARRACRTPGCCGTSPGPRPHRWTARWPAGESASTSFEATIPMTPRCQPSPATTRTLWAPTSGRLDDLPAPRRRSSASSSCRWVFSTSSCSASARASSHAPRPRRAAAARRCRARLMRPAALMRGASTKPMW